MCGLARRGQRCADLAELAFQVGDALQKRGRVFDGWFLHNDGCGGSCRIPTLARGVIIGCCAPDGGKALLQRRLLVDQFYQRFYDLPHHGFGWYFMQQLLLIGHL